MRRLIIAGYILFAKVSVPVFMVEKVKARVTTEADDILIKNKTKKKKTKKKKKLQKLNLFDDMNVVHLVHH